MTAYTRAKGESDDYARSIHDPIYEAGLFGCASDAG